MTDIIIQTKLQSNMLQNKINNEPEIIKKEEIIQIPFYTKKNITNHSTNSFIELNHQMILTNDEYNNGYREHHEITIDEPQIINHGYLLYKQISKKLKETINDQDSIQRYNVFLTILIEIYRVVTSSLLILFVPQKCGDHVCSLTENIILKSPYYNTILIFNFITLFSFIIMYVLEIKRENRLIKYLDVNINMPNDNKDIIKTLDLLPIDKKNKILNIDKYYQSACFVTIIFYLLNTIFSVVIVQNNYLNSQTAATFVTYVLFMFTKLNNVYSVANTEENVFYSAYLKTNIQFNDLDTAYSHLKNNIIS